MKSYYVDEISKFDMEKITAYLCENAKGSGMERLFWVEMPSDFLTDFQSEHSLCKPYRFAIETGDRWLRAELFVRTSVKFRCDCNGYCNNRQKEIIMSYVDDMLNKLDIRT